MSEPEKEWYSADGTRIDGVVDLGDGRATMPSGEMLISEESILAMANEPGKKWYKADGTQIDGVVDLGDGRVMMPNGDILVGEDLILASTSNVPIVGEEGQRTR